MRKSKRVLTALLAIVIAITVVSGVSATVQERAADQERGRQNPTVGVVAEIESGKF